MVTNIILKLGVLPTTQTKPDYKIVKRPETIAPDDLFKCCSYNFPNFISKYLVMLFQAFSLLDRALHSQYEFAKLR